MQKPHKPMTWPQTIATWLLIIGAFLLMVEPLWLASAVFLVSGVIYTLDYCRSR